MHPIDAAASREIEILPPILMKPAVGGLLQLTISLNSSVVKTPRLCRLLVQMGSASLLSYDIGVGEIQD
jgi:hypothetical protein